MAEFEIVQKIGEGSYSTVFIVKRKSDAQVYALKQVRFFKLKNKERENALNEVRILASVNNSNVIAYKEAFFADNTLSIVMEFADAGDLYQRIKEHKKNKTKFSEQEVWEILTQGIKGLKALHDLGIVHRDIKSANFFLFKDGRIKLGDMNVSKVAKLGLVYTQTGTPYYASPEIWKDQPYDQKSDIWSFGCVLYEVCALEPPFRANDMKGLYTQVTKGDCSRIPEEYSNGLWKIIKSMLKVNPGNRPTCDNILEKHSPERNHETENSVLLKTIYMNGSISTLRNRLPRPAYDRPQRILSEKALRSQLVKPLRVYNGELRHIKSPIQGTLAAKIKAIKQEVERRPTRVPVYNRPVVRNNWWG